MLSARDVFMKPVASTKHTFFYLIIVEAKCCMLPQQQQWQELVSAQVLPDSGAGQYRVKGRLSAPFLRELSKWLQTPIFQMALVNALSKSRPRMTRPGARPDGSCGTSTTSARRFVVCTTFSFVQPYICIYVFRQHESWMVLTAWCMFEVCVLSFWLCLLTRASFDGALNRRAVKKLLWLSWRMQCPSSRRQTPENVLRKLWKVLRENFWKQLEVCLQLDVCLYMVYALIPSWWKPRLNTDDRFHLQVQRVDVFSNYHTLSLWGPSTLLHPCLE